MTRSKDSIETIVQELSDKGIVKQMGMRESKMVQMLEQMDQFAEHHEADDFELDATDGFELKLVYSFDSYIDQIRPDLEQGQTVECSDCGGTMIVESSRMVCYDCETVHDEW